MWVGRPIRLWNREADSKKREVHRFNFRKSSNCSFTREWQMGRSVLRPYKVFSPIWHFVGSGVFVGSLTLFSPRGIVTG